MGVQHHAEKGELMRKLIIHKLLLNGHDAGTMCPPPRPFASAVADVAALSVSFWRETDQAISIVIAPQKRDGASGGGKRVQRIG